MIFNIRRQLPVRAEEPVGLGSGADSPPAGSGLRIVRHGRSNGDGLALLFRNRFGCGLVLDEFSIHFKTLKSNFLNTCFT